VHINIFERSFDMKKMVLLFFGLVLALSSIFARGQSSGTSGGAKKPTLTAWFNTPASNTEAYMRAFSQKYPQYDLQLSFYMSEDFKTQTRMAFASGTAPDVTSTNSGSTFMEYVDEGYAYDLTDLVKQKGWDRKITRDVIELNSKNGRIYAVGTGVGYQWQSLWYNKTKLDAMGITIPYKITVDDLLQIIPKIKASGMQPIAFGDVDGWPAVLMIGDYLLQTSDPTLIDRLNAGTVHWDTSPECKAAVTAMVKLAQGGAFVPGWESQNHMIAQQQFIGQVAAFMYMGTWWINDNGGTGTDFGFEIGVTNLPYIDRNTRLRGAQFSAAASTFINSKTKNLNEAIDFLDYLMADEAAFAQMADSGTYSSNPEANKNAKLDPLFLTPPFTDQLSLPNMNYMDHACPVPVIETIKVELQKAMMGTISVDQALKNIETAHAKER
jgi:raffinose/stachyose/melibiose transport system substrate-binding protein